MKSLRDYLDIITQLDERVSIGADGKVTGGLTPQPAAPAPAAPAPAAAPAAAPAPATPAAPAPAAPAKMADGGPPATPEQLKWLGGADPTDKFILARMRKAVPNAPAAAPAAAAPAPAPALTAADQEDADMGKAMAANAQAATQAANGVNAAGQNVTMPDGTNPETGEKTTVANAAPAAPEQAAMPAAAASRDAMPFGKAFADAKAKGEKTFMWKGKSYAVQMADPANKTAEVAKRTGVAMNSTAGGGRGNVVPPTVKESTTSYDEVQRLVSLVQHR